MSKDQASTESPSTPGETSVGWTTQGFIPPSDWTAEKWKSAKTRPALEDGKVSLYISAPETSNPFGKVKLSFEGSALPGVDRGLEGLKWAVLTEEFLRSMAEGKFKSKFRCDVEPTFKDAVVQTFIKTCKDPKMNVPQCVNFLPMSEYTQDMIELVWPESAYMFLKDVAVGDLRTSIETIRAYSQFSNFLKSRVEEELDKTYSPPETVGPPPTNETTSLADLSV